MIFLSLVIILQLHIPGFLLLWGIVALGAYHLSTQRGKKNIMTTFVFGIGYYLFLTFSGFSYFQNATINILLGRSMLVLVLLLLLVFSFKTKSPWMYYWKKPNWNHTIHFPFIWSGLHPIKIKIFLLIAITINIMALYPFIHYSIIKNIIFLTIAFSIINAALEELIWRGVLLSRFSEQVGEKWAVVITSLGFGLQHYSLGFSWMTCLFFSLGGFFYGGVTVKSESIFPAFIWHFMLNVLMIGSGVIRFA